MRFIANLILSTLILFTYTQIFADCMKQSNGLVVCGKGQCLQQSNGLVVCSNVTDGQCMLQSNGLAVCEEE